MLVRSDTWNCNAVKVSELSKLKLGSIDFKVLLMTSDCVICKHFIPTFVDVQ